MEQWIAEIPIRKYVGKLLGFECLTFAVAWKIFLEMEENVEGSFLQQPAWLSLQEPEK